MTIAQLVAETKELREALLRINRQFTARTITLSDYRRYVTTYSSQYEENLNLLDRNNRDEFGRKVSK